MKFMLIKGTFHVKGRQPDGDTIGFKAENKQNWAEFESRFKTRGQGIKTNRAGVLSIRLKAIDTLETHYEGNHQPSALARKATDFLLEEAGIKEVAWDGASVASAQDETHGYILSRAIDKSRRPTCFAFAGNTERKDGELLPLDAEWLKNSINYKLLEQGLAYPTFYKAMLDFPDLRKELANIAMASAEAKLGVWAVDKSRGISIRNKEQLEQEGVIMPKLFRILTEYFKEHPDGMDRFHSWLQDWNEEVCILPSGNTAGLHEVIEKKGEEIKLTVDPWEMIFRPRHLPR